MANQEQHLTMARLSAYIDGQLSVAEQQQTEAHLQQCALCQQQLAELRQTVALLRALPKPALPRSFVLSPGEATLSVQQTSHLLHPLHPIRLQAPDAASSRQQQKSLAARASGTMRIVSSLVALVGIFLLLSSMLGTIIPVSRSSNFPRITASQAGTATPGTMTPHVLTPRTSNNEAPATVPSTKGQTVAGANGHTTPVPQPNVLQAFLDVRTLMIRVLLGVILLALGITGLLVLARRI